MNQEARQKFLRFAMDVSSPWLGNFRDLNAAVIRMATLAPRGRIRVEEVDEEMGRLRQAWHRPERRQACTLLLEDYLSADVMREVDPFDQPQLTHVIEVCLSSKSLSDAGRKLFSVSRQKKKNPNDADRLKKYLAKFGLEFEQLGTTTHL